MAFRLVLLALLCLPLLAAAPAAAQDQPSMLEFLEIYGPDPMPESSTAVVPATLRLSYVFTTALANEDLLIDLTVAKAPEWAGVTLIPSQVTIRPGVPTSTVKSEEILIEVVIERSSEPFRKATIGEIVLHAELRKPLLSTNASTNGAFFLAAKPTPPPEEPPGSQVVEADNPPEPGRQESSADSENVTLATEARPESVLPEGETREVPVAPLLALVGVAAAVLGRRR